LIDQAYATLLRANGISITLPVLEMDRRVAALLEISPRQARRYRGMKKVPKQTRVVLALMAEKKQQREIKG